MTTGKMLAALTIGSVQNYISNSISTRELINSSKIISDIIRDVTQDLEIIYPQLPKGLETKNSLGNSIVFTYDRVDKRYSEAIAKKIEYVYLKMLKTSEHDGVKFPLPIYWAEIPLTDNYSDCYNALMAQMIDLKNAKNVEKYLCKKIPGGKDCKLCGKELQKNEYCIHCLLKRDTGNSEQNNIPTTIEIAANQMITTEMLRVINDENMLFSKVNTRQELFDRLEKNEDLLKFKEGIKSRLDNCSFTVGVANQIKKLDIVFNNPLPYYCIYRMDIDNLGKWMAGKYRNDKIVLRKYQEDLSITIGEFISALSHKIESYKAGKLVYAGGDDVLALLSGPDALDLGLFVEKQFKEKVRSKADFAKLSYSQGLFFTHYKMVFSEVIRRSSEKLQKVKRDFKGTYYDIDLPKNMTIISVLNEGYNHLDLYFKNIDNYISQSSNFEKFIAIKNYFTTDKTSFFHEQLSKLVMPVAYNLQEYAEKEFIKDLVIQEQKRLMRRASKIKSDDNTLLESAEKTSKEFFLDNCFYGNSVDLNNYFNLFSVIKCLKRGCQDEEQKDNEN